MGGFSHFSKNLKIGVLVLAALSLVVCYAGTLAGLSYFYPPSTPVGVAPEPTDLITPTETVASPAGPTETMAPTESLDASFTPDSAPDGDTPIPTETVLPATLTPTAELTAGDLNAVQVSMLSSAETGIRVEIRYADGSPKTGSWVGIYEQTTDVSDNPIQGERVASGRTDDAGICFQALSSGTYSVSLGDMTGYPWGNEYNYQVQSGKATVILVTLTQIQIGVRNADEEALSGKWTGVYLQDTDISGNPVKGERVATGRTDNTGTIIYNLTPGIYTVEIGDISGDLWGQELNHTAPSGGKAVILLTLGRLTIGVINADDAPVSGRWVGVYFQEQDVSGNPTRGDRFLSGRTENTGLVSWDLTAGTYAIEIGDISGNLWGEEINHAIISGETTSVVLNLGRLTIGLKDSSGNPIENRWVGVYYQEKDVNGNPTQGDRFLSGRTDNTGIISWDITDGNYVVEIADLNTLIDVPVQSGKTTSVDGYNYSIP